MEQNSDAWNKIFTGIKNGKRAFCGPYVAQIDLTDKCNNACVGCWVHSAFLDKKSIFPRGQKELSLEFVEKLIKELYPDALTIFTEGLGHTRILRNDAVIKQIIEVSSNCLAQAH